MIKLKIITTAEYDSWDHIEGMLLTGEDHMNPRQKDIKKVVKSYIERLKKG